MFFFKCWVTVGIRIVADCGAIHFQFTMKLKRATTLEFTTVSAIIFIHCCAFVLYFLYSFRFIFFPLARWGIFLIFLFLGSGLRSSFAGFGRALALSDLQMCLQVCEGYKTSSLSLSFGKRFNNFSVVSSFSKNSFAFVF